MTPKQRQARDAKIAGAMAQLIHDTRFSSFIDLIREQREVAIEDLCSDRVVANERMTLAAVGEIRAYRTIIAAHDEFFARAEAEREQIEQNPPQL